MFSWKEVWNIHVLDRIDIDSSKILLEDRLNNFLGEEIQQFWSSGVPSEISGSGLVLLSITWEEEISSIHVTWPGASLWLVGGRSPVRWSTIIYLLQLNKYFIPCSPDDSWPGSKQQLVPNSSSLSREQSEERSDNNLSTESGQHWYTCHLVLLSQFNVFRSFLDLQDYSSAEVKLVILMRGSQQKCPIIRLSGF